MYKRPVADWVECISSVLEVMKFKIKGAMIPNKNAIQRNIPSKDVKKLKPFITMPSFRILSLEYIENIFQNNLETNKIPK